MGANCFAICPLCSQSRGRKKKGVKRKGGGGKEKKRKRERNLIV